jgi:hypothetical protein
MFLSIFQRKIIQHVKDIFTLFTLRQTFWNINTYKSKIKSISCNGYGSGLVAVMVRLRRTTVLSCIFSIKKGVSYQKVFHNKKYTSYDFYCRL